MNQARGTSASFYGVVLFFVACVIATPTSGATIASVVGVENTPRLLSDGGGRDLKVADQLQMGDRVELESGSRALLMYAQTFQVFAVDGPAVVTVLPDAVMNERSGEMVEPMKTASLMPVAGKARRHGPGTERIGGVRMRGRGLQELVKKDELSAQFARHPASPLAGAVAERALQFDRNSALYAHDVLAADLSQPNFAGKYVLVESACGADCVRPVLVDLVQARVRALGVRWNNSDDVLYRAQSNLLLLNQVNNGRTQTRRFVLDGDALEQL